MPLFHVEIVFDAESVPEQDRVDVLERERERGIELYRSGALQRIWRVPGTASSISIWEAASEPAVREMLDSLPIAPWCRFDVNLVEVHPLEAAARAD